MTPTMHIVRRRPPEGLWRFPKRPVEANVAGAVKLHTRDAALGVGEQATKGHERIRHGARLGTLMSKKRCNTRWTALMIATGLFVAAPTLLGCTTTSNQRVTASVVPMKDGKLKVRRCKIETVTFPVVGYGPYEINLVDCEVSTVAALGDGDTPENLDDEGTD